jgi:hypothetical protein
MRKTMMTATPSSTQRVCYPIGRRFELFYSLALLVLVISVLVDLLNRLRTGQTSDIGIKIFMLVGLLYFLLNSVRALYKKIIITPDGLTFHQLSFHIATPWSNLDQLYYLNHAGRSIGVLRLHEPAPVNRSRFAIVREGSMVAIPLLDYDYGPGSPLRKELERYAPHLFRSPSAN